MSVLVKGMEMPKHCGYCRFRYDGICHALQKTQYAVTDCPLVEVPAPPGELIDRSCFNRYKEPDEFSDQNFMCSIPMIKGKFKE